MNVVQLLVLLKEIENKENVKEKDAKKTERCLENP